MGCEGWRIRDLTLASTGHIASPSQVGLTSDTVLKTNVEGKGRGKGGVTGTGRTREDKDSPNSWCQCK